MLKSLQILIISLFFLGLILGITIYIIKNNKKEYTCTTENCQRPSSCINNVCTPSKGLVVFDIDDTLRVMNGDWCNCQWRTQECGFPHNNLDDTQKRAIKAINTFYDMDCDVAVYTRESNTDIEKSGSLSYIIGLAKYINNPKFKNDIVDDYKNNKGFGTSTKLNPGQAKFNKGTGLKILADNFSIPHNKVLMFDDKNENIQDIIDNGFCGITVSNEDNTCGISEKNLQEGIDFINNQRCLTPPIRNPSTFKNDQDHSEGVKCAKQ